MTEEAEEEEEARAAAAEKRISELVKKADEQVKDAERSTTAAKAVLVVAALVFVAVLSAYALGNWTVASLGAVGDTFGGHFAAAGGLAGFFLMFAAFRHQSAEMVLQRAELIENREVMRSSQQAQEDAAKAQDRLAKAQERVVQHDLSKVVLDQAEGVMARSRRIVEVLAPAVGDYQQDDPWEVEQGEDPEVQRRRRRRYDAAQAYWPLVQEIRNADGLLARAQQLLFLRGSVAEVRSEQLEVQRLVFEVSRQVQESEAVAARLMLLVSGGLA